MFRDVEINSERIAFLNIHEFWENIWQVFEFYEKVCPRYIIMTNQKKKTEQGFS